MNGAQWFAASLVFAVLRERSGLWRRATSVVLVRAGGFEDAFDLVCNRGLEREETYLNREGEQVRWAFERVATLDLLPEVLSDGVEVYFELGDTIDDSSICFDVAFDPRRSAPGQSGVSPT